MLDHDTTIEQVVLLDESDEPIGATAKREVHGSATPRHLAFSAYVFDDTDRLLVTRRALDKQAWAGVWTNSCCGHPGPGEPMDGAVRRRLREELGLVPTSIRLVLPDYSYVAVSPEGIVENELCPVFVCRVDAEPTLVRSEVIEYQWVPWSDFQSLSRSTPWALSPWAVEQTALMRDIEL